MQNEPLSLFVEVIGRVESDLSISAVRTSNWGDNFGNETSSYSLVMDSVSRYWCLWWSSTAVTTIPNTIQLQYIMCILHFTYTLLQLIILRSNVTSLPNLITTFYEMSGWEWVRERVCGQKHFDHKMSQPNHTNPKQEYTLCTCTVHTSPANGIYYKLILFTTSLQS